MTKTFGHKHSGSAFLETKRWPYEHQMHKYRGAEGSGVLGGNVPLPQKKFASCAAFWVLFL